MSTDSTTTPDGVGDETLALGWLDAGVCAASLAASALIGCYFGCRKPQHKSVSDDGETSGADEYLRGSKSMSVIPVALSLVASFISGVTLLGLPAEIYRSGTQFLACMVGFTCMGTAVITVFLPLFYSLKLDSAYQYLELRFDRRVRHMASILYVINQVLFIPIVIYVPALALSQVTGAQIHVATPLTSIVCIFYTTFGGLRAVVWTDALQTVLMLASTVAVVILGVGRAGGLGQVWDTAERGHRLQLFNLNPSPLERHTLWTVTVGTTFMYLAQCAVGQGFVQRYLAVPSLRAARWTVLWFTLGLAAVSLLSGFTGLVLYALYHDCDPLLAGRVSRVDQLVPLFVVEVANQVPGLPGLFVAGVFSAALRYTLVIPPEPRSPDSLIYHSSMSTGVNAVCGVLVEDVLVNRLPRRLSKGAWLRITAAATGALCLALVFVVERLGGVLQVTISLAGITGGASLGLFLLGMFWPRATSNGALAGSVSSLALMGMLVFAAQSALVSGRLKHQMLPFSTSGCHPLNFTTPT